MDSLNEKVSYLKGLCEGLKISEATNEGRIIKGILEILEEMADAISDLEDEQFELQELAEEIDEDLGNLEEDFYGEEYDNECDEEFFEIECPECKQKIYIDDDGLFDDGVICPNCEEKIDLDYECECDCDCCNDHE